MKIKNQHNEAWEKETEIRYKKRDKRKNPKMIVSGQGVKNLQKLILK